MFDRAQMVGELRQRMATVGAADPDDSGPVLPVAAPLAAALPRGGLARGSVVSVLGQGATRLLFTLLAGPEAPWTALVGMPGVGLLAAAEFGIDLDRVVVIPEPGPDVLQVLSILVDGVDMIAVALPSQVMPSPSRQRVLTGRLRQRGSVLLVMGSWPVARSGTGRRRQWPGSSGGSRLPSDAVAAGRPNNGGNRAGGYFSGGVRTS